MRLAAVVLAGISLSVLSASSRSPHEQAAQAQQPIRVGTNFVRVDAYPTINGEIVAGLQSADFEVLEDGVLQRIETFEHIVPALGPQSARVEPGSQRDMLRAVANARNRVFVIFLDAPNVSWASAATINERLIDFLNRYVGDDDLVALMTPEMSTSNVIFGRKTLVIEAGLRQRWNWGRLGRQDPEIDKREIQYELCHPKEEAGANATKIACDCPTSTTRRICAISSTKPTGETRAST
jgi:hypothetical protein